eukprot:3523600-Prymnesium_polylepis.1
MTELGSVSGQMSGVDSEPPSTVASVSDGRVARFADDVDSHTSAPRSLLRTISERFGSAGALLKSLAVEGASGGGGGADEVPQL